MTLCIVPAATERQQGNHSACPPQRYHLGLRLRLRRRDIIVAAQQVRVSLPA